MVGVVPTRSLAEPGALTPALVRALRQGVFSVRRFWTGGEIASGAGNPQRLIYAASGQIGLRVFR